MSTTPTDIRPESTSSARTTETPLADDLSGTDGWETDSITSEDTQPGPTDRPQVQDAVNLSIHDRSEAPPPEQPGTGHGPDSSLLQIMSQIRDDQRRITELLEIKFHAAPDILEVAQSLWDNPHDAWVGSDEVWGTPDGLALGTAFLNSLAPCGSTLVPTSREGESDGRDLIYLDDFRGPRQLYVYEENLLIARKVFKGWVDELEENKWPWSGISPWREEYLHGPDALKQDILDSPASWPNTWAVHAIFPAQVNQSWVSWAYATSQSHPTSFNGPFSYVVNRSGVIKNIPMNQDGGNLSGLISHFSIDHPAGLVTFPTVAAILSLANQEFLDGHIAEWREKPAYRKSQVARLQTTLPFTPGWKYSGRFIYSVFMHFMRSFIVAEPWCGIDATEIPPVGLKCKRDQVSVQGFYNDDIIRIVERRYCMELSILPIVQPYGHFVLTSVIDTNPGQPKPKNAVERDVHADDHSSPWKRYGILPASLYTGISMFQLQICSFIEVWAADWINTVDRIDEMVSVKFNILNDFDRLKTLVIETKSDSSVSYFKVLQMLRLFSDSVEAATRSLETLIPNDQTPPLIGGRLKETHPDSETTRKIISHNWDIVMKHQRDASGIILARLERTTNEVKSLRDGLFNVQSVREAQKTRTLSKYLMVFTMVTIAFLPPTFVATFFGMELFHSSTTEATQTSFWGILAGVSVMTYVIAGIGIFGSRLRAEKRRQLTQNIDLSGSEESDWEEEQQERSSSDSAV